jgi:hypothetical protein
MSDDELMLTPASMTSVERDDRARKRRKAGEILSSISQGERDMDHAASGGGVGSPSSLSPIAGGAGDRRETPRNGPAAATPLYSSASGMNPSRSTMGGAEPSRSGMSGASESASATAEGDAGVADLLDCETDHVSDIIHCLSCLLLGNSAKTKGQQLAIVKINEIGLDFMIHDGIRDFSAHVMIGQGAGFFSLSLPSSFLMPLPR